MNAATSPSVVNMTVSAKLSFYKDLQGEFSLFNALHDWELGYGGAIFMRGARLTLMEVREIRVGIEF